MSDRLAWLTVRPIAHRGLHDASRGRPENSLAAAEAAVNAGFAIECDLHPAADGVPVVFHDDDLARLTGQAGCVRDRTSRELAAARLAGTAEHVPTLMELLDLVAGRVPLVIELKDMPGRDAGFVQSVAEALAGYDGPVGLMSFAKSLVAEIKAAAPGIPRGLTAEGSGRAGLAHLPAVLTLKPDFISYSLADLPTPVPLLARRVLGIPLISWTVRTPADRRKAARWTDQITFEGFTP